MIPSDPCETRRFHAEDPAANWKPAADLAARLSSVVEAPWLRQDRSLVRKADADQIQGSSDEEYLGGTSSKQF